MNRIIYRYNNMYSRIIIILSCISFFIIVFQNDYNKSTTLPILPFLFLILFFVSSYVFRNIGGSITTMIAYFGFFIRMVISPLIIVLSEYNIEIPNNGWEKHITDAVLLIAYEYLAFFVYLMGSKRAAKIKRLRDGEYVQDRISSQRINYLTKVIIVGSIGFIAFCLITNPSYIITFKNIFDFLGASESDIIVKNNLYIQMISNSSSLYTLFTTAIVFVQVIAPATILNAIYKGRQDYSQYWKRRFGLLLSFLVLILSLSILTEDHAKTIVLCAAIFMTLANVYPVEMKNWIPVFVIGGFAGAVFLLLVKTGVFIGKYDGIQSIARIANTYFAGVPNVAIGLSLNYPDKLSTLGGDFFRSIPIIAHFFMHLPRSQDLFNYAYHGVSGYTNEIMPTICYGWQYLGIFAPALTLFIYHHCYKLEEKFIFDNKVFNKAIYAYLLIYFAICPFMYMFTSFLTMFWYSLIFMIIIRSNSERIQSANENI